MSSLAEVKKNRSSRHTPSSSSFRDGTGTCLPPRHIRTNHTLRDPHHSHPSYNRSSISSRGGGFTSRGGHAPRSSREEGFVRWINVSGLGCRCSKAPRLHDDYLKVVELCVFMCRIKLMLHLQSASLCATALTFPSRLRNKTLCESKICVTAQQQNCFTGLN